MAHVRSSTSGRRPTSNAPDSLRSQVIASLCTHEGNDLLEHCCLDCHVLLSLVVLCNVEAAYDFCQCLIGRNWRATGNKKARFSVPHTRGDSAS